MRLIEISLVLAFTLIVFFFGLPIMFINDEWITGNQLNQLDIGSQIIFSEGKFGSNDDGTEGAYFTKRDNILQYSSYLPISSYSVLFVVKYIGYYIPFLFSTIIAFAMILIGIQIRNLASPERKVFICSYILIIISLVFFGLNIAYYAPIPLDLDTSPYEILGVYFYHLIVLSLLLFIINSISTLLFSTNKFSLFATISCITCSSYLFWATTLKDHIDTVFLLTLILYLCLLSIHKKDIYYLPAASIVSGLLIWVRPEYGVIIAGTVFIIYGIILFFNENNYPPVQKFLLLGLAPVCTFIGSIPLLVGNYFTTGNAFLLAWQVQSATQEMTEEIANASAIPGDTTITTVISTIIHRLTPQTDSLLTDIYGFLIQPATLKMPLLALTPLFVLGLLLLPFIYIYLHKRVTKDEWIIIGLLGTFVLVTILAYATSITGLGASMGVYPDVRYLSPVYLPLNLIGLLLIRKVIPYDCIPKIITGFVAVIALGIPLVIGIMTYFHSSFDFWDMFLYINGISPVLIYISIGVAFLSICFKIFGVIEKDYYVIPIAFLLGIPLLWQIALMIIGNFYPGIFISYPPLLPAVRALFEYLAGFSPG